LLLVFLGVLAGCGRQEAQQTISQPSLEELENIWWGDNPELGTGPVTYEVLPLEPIYFSLVSPLGHLAGSHPIPTDHVYFELSRTDLGATVEGFGKPVYAPAKGVIVHVKYGINAGYPDYTVKIKHTNNFVTVFGHLSTVEPFIMEHLAGYDLEHLPEPNYLYVTVEAGQVIGKTAAEYAQSAALDMYTGDRSVTHFIHPEKFGPSIPHAVCPFEYFKDDLKNYLYANKVLRTKEPRGGEIDYDLPGKLVGNWLHESYERSANQRASDASEQFSFAYDMYDPDYLRISVASIVWAGDFDSGSLIYRVKGNGPDFKYIDVASGEVVYELQNCIEGQESVYKDDPRYPKPSDEVVAKLLVKMESDERIKVEYFRELTPGFDNPQFTSNAKYFTR